MPKYYVCISAKLNFSLFNVEAENYAQAIEIVEKELANKVKIGYQIEDYIGGDMEEVPNETL